MDEDIYFYGLVRNPASNEKARAVPLLAVNIQCNIVDFMCMQEITQLFKVVQEFISFHVYIESS